MIKIMLFGTGNFAKHHMEGIKNFAKVEGGVKIQLKVWDDYLYFQSGGEKVQEELDSVFKGYDVECFFKKPEALEFFDISIDATNVKGRINNLSVRSGLKVLEKPLANSLEELEHFYLDDSLKDAKVNCARRLWKIYSDIENASELKNGSFEMKVRLNKAGLLSNAIHFFDLFEWLSGSQIQNVEIPKLKVFESKRLGFSEGAGILRAHSSATGRYAFMEIEDNCIDDQSPSSFVEITTNDTKFEINETIGQVKKKTDGLTKTFSFDPTDNYQSILTSKILKNYMHHVECDLANAGEFLRLNKLFLIAISEAAGKVEFT